MTKSDCIARLAIPVGLRTLPANRPQFVTLELSLAAGQAGGVLADLKSAVE